MDELCDNCKDKMGDVRLTEGDVLCSCCFEKISQHYKIKKFKLTKK